MPHSGVSAVHDSAAQQRARFDAGAAQARHRRCQCAGVGPLGDRLGGVGTRRDATHANLFPLQSAQPGWPRIPPRGTGAARGFLRTARPGALLRRDSLRLDPRPLAATPAHRARRPGARRAHPHPDGPSKTYNVPGLGTSFAIIPDATLRARFVRATAGIVAEVTCLGYTACEAAYRDGESWRQALLAYLRGNRDFLLATLARDLPGVRLEAPLEATYLAWLNVGALGLADPVAHFEAHGVGLSDGRFFGAKPGAYVRINLGCPRATLAEALRRMAAAVAALPPPAAPKTAGSAAGAAASSPVPCGACVAG